MAMTIGERAREWLRQTWPWSLDDNGPSEREVRLLAALLDEVTAEFRSALNECARQNGERRAMLHHLSDMVLATPSVGPDLVVLANKARNLLVTEPSGTETGP